MKLPDALSAPSLLRLWDLLPQARVVGGAVRDSLAERPVADIDLSTPLAPRRAAEVLEGAGIRVIPTGLAHGTITALVDGQPFEVTTLRRDVATDGRHAVVAFTDDWREDAARRDFTINAMSIDRDGTVYDYFDGRADLAAGAVRFVGDPVTRIAEDHLRVLRFFRFFGRYGRQGPDVPTRQALQDAAPQLSRLSPERIWSEMQRILATPDPDCAVIWMDRLGILGSVVPGPLTLDRFRRLLAMGAPSDALLRLAALSDAGTEEHVARYRMSSADAARLEGLRGDAPADDADELCLRHYLIDVPRQYLIERTWLHGRGDSLRDRIRALPDLVFPVQGRDLVALGMAPGPELGRRLAELREIWRQGGGTANRVSLLNRQHLSRAGSPPDGLSGKGPG